MSHTIKGNNGEYFVKNESTIIQYKLDDAGNQTGECVLHIITDSIEDSEDRNNITKIIEEYS